MIKIDLPLLDNLTSEAQKAERKRKNHNFHFGGEDHLQRMLNAFEPGTYVRPHKHGDPPKREVFLLIRGRLLLVFFDDDGKICHRVILDSGGECRGVEIDPGEWHTAVSLKAGTIIYELKDGPYDPLTDKQFAPWAPEEGSPEAKVFLEQLLSER